jgi:hypothetical protein
MTSLAPDTPPPSGDGLFPGAKVLCKLDYPVPLFFLLEFDKAPGVPIGGLQA